MFLGSALIGLLLIGWVAGSGLTAWASNPDTSVLGFVGAHAGDRLQPWVAGFTWLGSLVVLLPLAVIALALLIRAGQLQDAVFLVVAVGGTIILVFTLKLLVERARPPVLHLVQTTTSSFPSAHAGDSLAVYGALAFVLTRGLPFTARSALTCAAAALLVLAIGWSRLYLEVHYLSDVLGAWLLVAAWLIVVARTVYAPVPTDPRPRNRRESRF